MRLAPLFLALLLGGCGLFAKPESVEEVLKPAAAAIDRAQAREPASEPADEPARDEDDEEPGAADRVEADPPTPPIATKDIPKGYVAMTPVSRSGDFGNAILLMHPRDDVMVPIFVGGTEALSIELRLEHKKFNRPLTHDLLDAFVSKMGARMIRAQIDSMRDTVYVGTVVFQKGQEVISLDARPSDAIALAIGNRVPIFVSEKLIAEVGIRPDDVDDKHPTPNAEPVAL